MITRSKMVKVVERGSYTPDELGLPFPEVPKIHVGFCVELADKGYMSWPWGTMNLAHTHRDLNTLNFCYQICVQYGGFIYNGEEPHDVMWHEYGHVLYPHSVDKVTIRKYGNFSQTVPEDQHCEGWQKVMLDLGKPHLANDRPITIVEDDWFERVGVSPW
jgi:hypothetical protein